MAVCTKEEQSHIIHRALGDGLAEALSDAQAELGVTESYPLEAFNAQSPHEQLLALSDAGVTLTEIGYGQPSDKTVALFGPDGKMQTLRSAQSPPGSTYES